MRRNSIFVFILYIAVMWMPLYVEAQSSPVSPGYWEEGNASWYGEEFSGRPTASGEIFNPTLFTAAHPTLPFGTFLFVTNKNNNRQVTVKVNDRGPFVASRIIDLSKAAAEHLDMINAGTVPVIIETLSSSYSQPPPEVPVISTPAPVYQPVPPPPVPQYATPFPQLYPPTPVPQYATPAPVYQPSQPYPPEPAAMPLAQPIPSETQNPNPYPPITVNVYPSGQSQVPPLAPGQPQPQLQPQAPPLLPAQTQYAQPLPPPLPPTQIQPQYAQPQMLPPLESSPPAIKLIPAITPLPGSLYKIQVGSFKVPRHAVDAFDKLKAAGLNPSYEPNGEFYRVVLTKIPGIEVQSVADKLARAGFREALIREDR